MVRLAQTLGVRVRNRVIEQLKDNALCDVRMRVAPTSIKMFPQIISTHIDVQMHVVRTSTNSSHPATSTLFDAMTQDVLISSSLCRRDINTPFDALMLGVGTSCSLYLLGIGMNTDSSAQEV